MNPAGDGVEGFGAVFAEVFARGRDSPGLRIMPMTAQRRVAGGHRHGRGSGPRSS